MNIQAFFPPLEECPQKADFAVWKELMDLRMKTFQGFAQIEETKGFIKKTFSLSTSKGQDALRILLFRALEEICEAIDSEDEAHRKEEYIDAINFLLCTALLDQELLPWIEIIPALVQASKDTIFVGAIPDRRDLGLITKLICGDLSETFRNRSWMEQAQDIYFAGIPEYLKTLETVMRLLLSGFSSFSEFYAYYVAKDRVLQFRLHTRY